LRGRGFTGRLAVIAGTAALLAPTTALAQDPGAAEWTEVPRDRVAAECGMDPDVLDAALPKFEHTPFVVIRHGKLCWEGGFPGGTTEKYQVYSVTKTFGAMLFGMIASRSTKLSDTDPVSEWIPPEELGGINPNAKLAHVLAMVSTNADLRPGHKGAWSYDTFGDREINRLEGVMNRAIAAEPERFPGVKNVVELAQKELFDPLGMTSSSWAGGGIASNLYSNVRDLARLGQLVLQRGRWQGRQLIDEEYLYRMTHPAFEDANTGYGYLTYVNAAKNWSWPTSTADTYCAPFGRWPSYPHRPFYEWPDTNGGVPGERQQRYDIAHTFASGTGGQKFIVYRGVDIVIAIRNGAGSVADGGTAADQFSGHKTVWNAVRPAMLPFDPYFKDDEAGFCAAYRRSDYAPDLREPWFPDTASAPAEVGSGPPAERLPSSAPAPPPTPRCVSRRRLRITVRRPHGMRIRRVSVRLDGRRVPVRRRGGQITAIIDLRGRGPGIAVVRIAVYGARRGKPARSLQTRAFTTCRNGRA
jgi:CubicO group peptidase (beta-lactamase class C family)